MMEAGEKHSLEIARILSQGAYLREKGDTSRENEVLLPGKELPSGAAPGDILNVFIYRDSKGRLISTTSEPFISLNGVARLKVKEMTKIGAFLDMGLERDLLLPFAEQTYEPVPGNYVLVSMYRDKSSRLAATMKVYEYLEKDHPYKKGDEVDAFIYEISRNFGAFAAVDMKYSALIPAREFSGEVKAGEMIRARVSGVKEDGKLDLSVRKEAYLQMDEDGEAILRILKENNGSIPLGDRSDPELIRSTFHMSKAAFKRAAGHLYRERRISIGEDHISVYHEN